MDPARAYHPEPLPTELRHRVRHALEGVPGIAGLLADPASPKFYVVLENTDMDRDYEIVRRLLDLGDHLGVELDYDLVPGRSVGMIPDSEQL